MKNITVIILLLANICSAQVSEDFNDDVFSDWSGNTSHFVINSNHQLQLNNTVAATSYITTSFAPNTDDLEWNVYVRQAFAGSANNYGRIYLLSSAADLTLPTEGYYLQLGEAGSNDAVELFRQSGTVSTSVCRAANATIAAAFAIRIKITRSNAGLWTVSIDYTGGTEYVEAASGIDATIGTGNYMGMLCVYTAGNAARFYYDDVYAGPPKLPPPPPDVASANDVVINEFFPDPSPVIGLPEQEFVEIYNRSSKTFDLDKWKIGDGSSLVSMPSVIIHPDEYVVITASDGLPSLNNGGDVIKIVDDHGVMIDSINYTLDWYQEESKSGGGYSIERLDPGKLSNEPTNWYVSQHETGGTPGARNSVFGRNPDSKLPVVKSIEFLRDSIVVRFSEPVVFDRENYNITGHQLAMLHTDTTTTIYLQNLTNGFTYKLTVDNVADLAGNRTNHDELTFTYFIPHPVSYNDVVVNEIMADPTPVVQLPEAEYIEVFNRSANPISFSGWHLEDATTSTQLPSLIIMPGGYMVFTSTTNASKFSNATGIAGFPSLGNNGDRIVLREPGGVAIDSMAYAFAWYHDPEKSDGGWSLERLNPAMPSNDETNWYASQHETGGTPGARNSVFGGNPDSKPPVVKSIRYLSDSIVIKFSEPVVFDRGNYNITGDPLTMLHTDTTTTIYLENLTNGLAYKLTIDNVADLAGNRTGHDELTFTYFIPHPVNYKDIIITEIMSDPAPVVQLPEAEYIEVFNRSINPISFSGWHLEDATSSTQLPSSILMPGKYLLIMSASNASRFPGAVGVAAFPSLGNNGDRMVLREPGGVAIDSVAYGLSWYHDLEKSEGGWSLELIDINNPCGEIDNWVASEDLDGGTPGEVNSVFANKPDITPPKLVTAFALSPDSLLLSFNEKLRDHGTISLDGDAFFTDLSKREVVYVLTGKLETRRLYEITVSDVRDCNGNLMEPVTAPIVLPEPAEFDDVVINEVLFNPRPNGADFVELYNRSGKYVNLKGWKLGDEVIASTNDILLPGSYRVLTSSIVATQVNYPTATSLVEMNMPSLPDDEGTVILTGDSGNIIDQFSYVNDMHSPILSDDEGVSLERISALEPADDPNNWHSSNTSAGYATPGYVNSNSRPSFTSEEGKISVLPELIDPSGSAQFTQIFYHFDRGGSVANVSVVDLEGRVIKTIASNETIGAEGSFQWDGDRDEGGAARSGYYLIWFQMVDLEGGVRTFRKRVVVGL